MYRKNVVLLPQGRLGLVMLGYIKIVGNMGYEKVGNMSNLTLQKLEKRAAACFYLFPTIFCGTCERNCRMSYQGMLKNGPKESQFLVLFLFSWLFGSFSTPVWMMNHICKILGLFPWSFLKRNFWKPFGNPLIINSMKTMKTFYTHCSKSPLFVQQQQKKKHFRVTYFL